MYKRLISALVLVAYSALLIKVMVFKSLPMVRIGHVMLNFGGTDSGHGPNFVPFATIGPYLLGYKGLIIAGINLVGNIVLLVPLGFLAPFVYPNITWKKSLALAIASGLAIECMQVLLRVGIFDIDDVILNALGFMVGYWAFFLLAKLLRAKNGILIASIGALILAAAAAYGYYKYPVSLEAAPIGGQSDRLGSGEGGDLCGGTGGNGQIVSVGSNEFTIRRGANGGNEDQVVHLASRAQVNTSAGPGSITNLKAGDRVTLVGGPNPDGSFTADAVFVCSK